MQRPAHFLQCALAAVFMTAASAGYAQSTAYSINSRGAEVDDQLVNALWRIDLQSGDAEYVGWTSFLDLEALAFSPDNELYGVDDESNTLVRISTVTGFAQPVGGPTNRYNTGLLPLNRNLDFGMSFTCSGDLLVVSDIEQSLFAADLETGKLTLIGAEGALGAPVTDIAVRGSDVFGIGVGLTATGEPAAPYLYRVDPETPSAELIGPLGSAAAPYNNAGLSFDADGRLWAVTDRRAVGGEDLPSQVLRIDPQTGSAELVAESIIGLESLAIAPPGACEDEDAKEHTGVQEIPLLSRSGQVLVALLLFLIGAVSLRRRLA